MLTPYAQNCRTLWSEGRIACFLPQPKGGSVKWFCCFRGAVGVASVPTCSAAAGVVRVQHSTEIPLCGVQLQHDAACNENCIIHKWRAGGAYT